MPCFRLGRNFPTVPNYPKNEKIYLIKLVSKWKRAIRKGYTRFLFFNCWDLKLVPIASIGNLTYFFQKCMGGIKKSSRTIRFFWDVLCDHSCVTGKCCTKNFLQALDQELGGWNRICQILILKSWRVTSPCFLPKIA